MSVWRFARRPTLCCAAVIMPAALEGQERRDTTVADSGRRVERVVITAARTPAAVGGTSALIVRPDSLAVSAAPLLEEALRATPFVLVRQNSRGEMEISVRGSDSRQAAVMLDGVPLTLGWDHRSDPSLVPLSGVQSLVFVRGLSSLLSGPNVLGGVIDLGLGRNDAGGAPRRQAWAGTTVDQYGGHALSIGGSTPVTLGSGTLTLRAGAGYHGRDGYRVTEEARDTTAEDHLRTNSDLRHYDAFAAVRWQGLSGRYAGITATGYSAERGVPPELHIAEPRLWRYPDQSRVFTAVSAGTGIVTTPLGTGSLELTGGYNGGKLEIESFADRDYTTLDGRELGDERTMTGRLTASHSLFGTGSLKAAVTAADIRYEETLDDDPPSDYQQRLWSTGAEVQWPVSDRVTVGGGVVYDAATTPETGNKESLGRVDAWGWRGAWTVRVSEPLRLHASVSRRARFPALRELYSGALNRFQPNPNLRPEQLTAAELGTTYGGDGTTTAGVVTLQAVAFHHRLEDAVVRTTVPNTSLFIRVNRDEILSTGIELLGEWRSSADPVRAVSFTGDLLAQHVRVHDDSANAERRPEHQPETRAALELGVPLGAGVRGSVMGRYTGAQYCVHPDTGGQVRLDAQTEGHVALERAWSVGRGSGVFRMLRTVLALDNATDATVYDQCGLPQPGRTLRLVVQLR